MRSRQQSVALAFAFTICVWTLPCNANAQRVDENAAERASRLARGSVGFRVGPWRIDHPQGDTIEISRSPQVELRIQRGVDQHLALENSLAAWRRVTNEIQTLPLGGERIVETTTYALPLFTSLKFYPLTTPADVIEPYIVGGVAFAIGVVHEAENAIGGGGTTIVTGFGVRTGVGLEIDVVRGLGIAAGGRYQWLRFSEELGSRDVFKGAGFDAGLTYNFQF